MIGDGERVFWSVPYNKVHFVDNPYILDDRPLLRRRNKYIDPDSFVGKNWIISYENKLKRTINRSKKISVFEKMMTEEKYRIVKNKIDALLPGEFVFDEGERYYVDRSVKLHAANLATGSKVFSIIKILLENGDIDEHTLLILDEPESHLHPEWQNSFVEVITLLVKEVGCHVVLTTQSPQFMLAVDAFMRKYEITDRCNFYQTKQIDGFRFVNYECVNDRLDRIYQDFVIHLSEMKGLRNECLLDKNME